MFSGRLPGQGAGRATDGLTRRALTDAGVVLLTLALLIALWYLLDTLLLLFAAILVAISIHIPADWLHEHTRLGRGPATGISLGLFVVLLALMVWLIVPAVLQQLERFDEIALSLWIDVNRALSRSYLGQQIVDSLPVLGGGDVPTSGDVVAPVTDAIAGAATSLVNGLVILVIGLYLALQPAMYRDGLVQLLPHARRQRARHVLQILAHSLKGWLLARFAAMIFLGIATTVGLQLIGVPLAFVLGVVAGLLNFVPIIGPLVALLPALLIASAQGIQPVVAVFVLYQALQTIETYALTPALQQVAVDLPAALALVFQLVMGIVGGALGVALGFPVALVVMLLVQMLYVEDVLGESVEIHGEHRDRYDRVA